MGRRSRKRGDALTTPAPAPPAARRRAPSERPRAPWHPFPLVELGVLVGRVLLVWGMALASLGGLETALREHFSGYASHALLLAALPAVLVAGVLFFAGAPWIAIPLAGAVALGVGFAWLRRGFRRRG